MHDIEEKGADVIDKHKVPLQLLHNKLTHNQFLALPGILVGCTTGLAGVGIKALVHCIQQVLLEITILAILNNNLVSEFSHAGYLGAELGKAEIALKMNLLYEQDRSLKSG